MTRVDVQFCKGFIETNIANVFCTDSTITGKPLKNNNDRFILQFNHYYRKGLMIRVSSGNEKIQEKGIPMNYFEIYVQHVSVAKPILAVGLAKPNYDRGMVGWYDESIGYHADDGYVFHNVGNQHNTDNLIGVFSNGDVVGVLTIGSKVYFTKNGIAMNRGFEMKQQNNNGQVVVEQQYLPTLSSSESDTTIKIVSPGEFKCDIYKFVREVLKLDLIESENNGNGSGKKQESSTSSSSSSSGNDLNSEMLNHCDGLKRLIIDVMQQQSLNDSLQKQKDLEIQQLKNAVTEMKNNAENVKKQTDVLLMENEKLRDLKSRFTVTNQEIDALPIEQLKELSRILLETQNTIHNKEKDLLDVELLCIVCQDKRKNTLFLPCKHLCVCECCAKSVKACPICRKEISDSIQTHL